MKTIFGAAFALLLAAAPVRSASANPKVDVSTFRLRDKSLTAAFSAFPDDCLQFQTNVRFTQSVQQDDGPPIVTPPTTSVEVQASNVCTFEFRDLFGGTTSQVVRIAPDLASATLTAIVPVSDGEVNANVTVNITWTANAPLQDVKTSSLTFDRATRTITWEYSVVKARQADVAGSIKMMYPTPAGPTLFELAQFPLGGALGKDNLGTRTVTFLGHH